MIPQANPSNAPEWSVSELAGALKRTLEDAFGYVRVRGEISGYRGPHASGHAYFCLKDEDASIDAVIWKDDLRPAEDSSRRRGWRSSSPGASPPSPASPTTRSSSTRSSRPASAR